MKTLTTIRNCTVKVKFQCPKYWDELEATDNESIRYCGECERSVYFSSSDEDTIENAKKGNCIAREIPSDEELPMMFLGEVEVQPVETEQQTQAFNWKQREDAITEAVRRTNPSKYCFNCGYATSEYRKSCKVCGINFTDVKIHNQA